MKQINEHHNCTKTPYFINLPNSTYNQNYLSYCTAFNVILRGYLSTTILYRPKEYHDNKGTNTIQKYKSWNLSIFSHVQNGNSSAVLFVIYYTGFICMSRMAENPDKIVKATRKATLSPQRTSEKSRLKKLRWIGNSGSALRAFVSWASTSPVTALPLLPLKIHKKKTKSKTVWNHEISNVFHIFQRHWNSRSDVSSPDWDSPHDGVNGVLECEDEGCDGKDDISAPGQEDGHDVSFPGKTERNDEDIPGLFRDEGNEEDGHVQT